MRVAGWSNSWKRRLIVLFFFAYCFPQTPPKAVVQRAARLQRHSAA